MQKSFVHRWFLAVYFAATVVAAPSAVAALLSVGDINLVRGATGELIVSGDVTSEPTYGYTLLLEVVPGDGAIGTVTFTPPPPLDIQQVGDPWPNSGTFTPFDTDSTGSLLLNGAVDDDGVFIASPVSFSGPLASFSVVASADAAGVWHVLLSTSAGDSSWEGLSTARLAGLVTVAVMCDLDEDCADGNVCTDDTCQGGVCTYVDNVLPCDDGLFCTTSDLCSAGNCVGSVSPCGPVEVCDDVCDQCVGGTCSPPETEVVGGRLFAITPAGGPDPVAIRVSGGSLGVSCVQDAYVSVEGQLQVEPVFQTPAVWQTVFAHGPEIIPGSDFVVVTECAGAVTSACVATRTFPWGDANDSSFVDLDDILLVLSVFSGNLAFASPENVEWLPCGGFDGGIVIDLDDILATLSAFSGSSYADVCPAACP